MVLGHVAVRFMMLAPHNGVQLAGGRPRVQARASTQQAESTAMLFATTSSTEQSSFESNHDPRPTPAGAATDPQVNAADIAMSNSFLGRLAHVRSRATKAATVP